MIQEQEAQREQKPIKGSEIDFFNKLIKSLNKYIDDPELLEYEHDIDQLLDKYEYYDYNLHCNSPVIYNIWTTEHTQEIEHIATNYELNLEPLSEFFEELKFKTI